MTDLIHVRYTKWDASLHWHFDGDRIEEDEYGTWLLVRPGSEYRRGNEPIRLDQHGFVLLIPTDDWWTAYFNGVVRADHGHLVYVDVNTVARWEGDTVHMIDLDLDVTMSPAGSVALLDEDEFETHRAKYGYPSTVVESTLLAADRLQTLMSNREEPFGTRGLGRVAQHLGWAPGRVVEGHRVASGRGGDPRFPGGTLALQFPHFERSGIRVAGYEQATINVELPFRITPRQPSARIEHLEWLEGYPAETFEFFDARIAVGRDVFESTVYRPDPLTKPEFPQPEGVVELLAPLIPGIEPGTPVSVWIDPEQAPFAT